MFKKFDNAVARDRWLDQEYPQRRATEFPGFYALENGWMLRVRMLEVTVFREQNDAMEAPPKG